MFVMEIQRASTTAELAVLPSSTMQAVNALSASQTCDCSEQQAVNQSINQPTIATADCYKHTNCLAKQPSIVQVSLDRRHCRADAASPASQRLVRICTLQHVINQSIQLPWPSHIDRSNPHTALTTSLLCEWMHMAVASRSRQPARPAAALFASALHHRNTSQQIFNSPLSSSSSSSSS